ncbi:MAG: hypothetical protein FE834_03375 [Gammaproteobacteria bacterium]|nr:hypothetical protein [Gammaproteobacteria bacterium]
MNQKILLLGISLLCLSSVYALELPEKTHEIGKQTLNIWFWELDDTVDDRSDIESNLLATINSAGYGSDVELSAYWLDSKFKNYQHFDDVIHKVDNIETQLDGFIDYIEDNYKESMNDYHILMTEGSWDASNGRGVTPGHQAIAADNNEQTAAHEMGHMLGASHYDGSSWFEASIMSVSWFYSRQNKFWSSDNKNIVKRTLGRLPHFPLSRHMDSINSPYSSQTYSSQTQYGATYSELLWTSKKAIVYELPVSSDSQYTINIEKANFDTYLYVYDEKGKLIVANDDGGIGYLSKLSNQYFGSAEQVYIVVSGWAHEQGSFDIKVSKSPASITLDPTKTYSIKTLNGVCGFEWDAVLDGNGYRNAKFDCSGRFDPVFFKRDSTGLFYIKAKAYGGTTCGLELDLSSTENGERNARFDCSSWSSPIFITKDSDGFYYIKTKAYHGDMCGLEWDSDLKNGERNAKFDCAGRADPMSIIELK